MDIAEPVIAAHDKVVFIILILLIINNWLYATCYIQCICIVIAEHTHYMLCEHHAAF